MDEKKQQFDFDTLSMFKCLWNNKKLIIITTAVTAILSGGVSFLVPNKYKSSAIVFPVAEGTTSHDLFSSGSKRNGLILGKEEEVDQMLQMLESDDIVEYVVYKYNLYNHYGIDTLNDPYYRHNVKKKFNKNVDISATKYMSIKVEVTDENPKMAADIANSIAEYSNTLVSGIFRKKAVEAFELVEQEYNLVCEKKAFLEDTLQALRGYGVLDYNHQADRYTQALGLALVENNSRAERIIKEQMDILAEYGGTYLEMREELLIYQAQFKIMHSKYVEAKVDAIEGLDRLFIVNEARVAEKKSSPQRSVIVLTSVVITFLLVVIVLLIKDSVQIYNSKK